MNRCFDRCGLSRSSEEIKTNFTVSDTCMLPSPSRSSAGTLQTPEDWFCGCHAPASRPAGAGSSPGAAGLLQPRRRSRGQARTLPGRDGCCPALLPRQLPSSPQGSDLQVLRVPAVGMRGDVGHRACPSPRRRERWRRGAAAGSGVLAPHGRERRSRRTEESKRRSYPVSLQKCCCSSS